jgi:pyrroline-5-carboxylate reductase
MAKAIIKGLIKTKEYTIHASDISQQRRNYIQNTYNINTTESNKDIIKACNIIILAVKPQNMKSLLDEIAPITTKDKIIISIAAGLTLDYFKEKFPLNNIVRTMPNVASLEQEGMTLISFSKNFPNEEKNKIEKLFLSVGKTIIIDENMINAFSTISGSGPAFLALFVETLIQAGTDMKLDKNLIIQTTIQTFIDTAKLLQSGIDPQHLREMVPSPAGTTAEGIKTFNENI